MLNIWTRGEVVLEAHIFEKAYPQARPRINKSTGAVYSPLEKHNPVRKQLMEFEGEPVDLPFWLTAHFFFSEHKHYTSVDTDNLVKALADSLQAMKVITNDNLMIGHIGTKNLCEEDFIWLEIRLGVQQSISYVDISKMPLTAS